MTIPKVIGGGLVDWFVHYEEYQNLRNSENYEIITDTSTSEREPFMNGQLTIPKRLRHRCG